MPLDTSKLPADQRLPPYSYSQPGLVLPAQPQPGQKTLQQPPPQPPLPPAPAVRPPGAAAQRPYAPQYQPDAPLQHPPLGQPLGDFGIGSVSAWGDTGLGGGHMGTQGGPHGVRGGSGRGILGAAQPHGGLSPQLEQFGMGESPTGNNSGAFPEELGALYPPPPGESYDPHVLNRQNLSNCGRHGPVPNIILTGGCRGTGGREVRNELGGSSPALH